MLLLFDLDDTLYSRSEQLPDNYAEKDLAEISLFPGALHLLTQKKLATKNLIKVLVTKGAPQLQRQKIKNLGIEPHFQRILICPRDEDKKQCFKNTLTEFPDEEGWVIGNRLDSEIRYGKELGLKTIYLRHGKYGSLQPKDAYEVPDYEVEQFEDVLRILQEEQS